MKRVRSMLGFDAAEGESGVALAMALIFGVVITIVAATALSFASSGLVKSSNDDDWNSAIAAAYAGLEDYQAHLSNDNTYQQYGNPLAPYSAKSTLKLPTGNQANPAFGTGKDGQWASITKDSGNGTQVASGSSYRYEVDNSAYADTGTLKIRVTGRVGTKTRSIIADLRQQGFINFLYFTNFEEPDPTIYPTDVNGNPKPDCTKLYAWSSPTARSANCAYIAFDGGDTINGPVHSNDVLRICQATFNGRITTANPTLYSGVRYLAKDSTGSSCGSQKFNYKNQQTTGPDYNSSIGMPATNGNLKQETRYDLTSTSVPRPGCLYTGPTKIVYSVNASGDGYMTVKSPNTKFTEVAAPDALGNYTAGTNAGSAAQCGAPGTGSNGLGSASGAYIPVITNNLIYVQSIPTSPLDKNYTSATTLPNTCGFTNSQATTTTTGNVTTTANNGVGYPITGESLPAPSYACPYGTRNGDVFVEGKVHAQNTISADNYTYVTDDILYQDTNADMLGLVSQKPIFIYNPIKYTGTCVSSCSATALLKSNTGDYNRTIDAAMISVSDTVQVQSVYGGGDRGTLTIYGALAQNYRGIVRSGSNGYIKAYNYDARLQYTAPPKFLSPVTTTYGVTVLQESPTAYTADGSKK